MHWLVWMAPRPAAFPLEPFKTSGNWSSLRAALSELTKASLIGWPPGAGEISIHRVLQAVTRNRLSEQEKTASLDAALAVIQTTLPSPAWDQKGWQLWEQLAPHCRNLLNRLQDHVLEPKATWLMNDLAFWLNNRAEHSEAEPLYRRALALNEKGFGPEHPNVATVLNNLALLLSVTNRLAEAELLYSRALAIDEKSLGPDHPNVAIRLSNLAFLLSNTNRLAEAEPLFRRAIAIDEKSLGPEHPNVARDLNNLAELLRAAKRLPEVEPLYRRVLRIFADFEHRTGHEHPHFRTALNNYAEVISARGLSQDAVAARVRSALADYNTTCLPPFGSTDQKRDS
jgi:tetratricopeptide (TPR) repeat protein